MTAKSRRTEGRPHEAVVWIDHDRAVIVEQDPTGRASVELLDRGLAETEAAFDARMVDEVGDEDRVIVSGPASARTDFERAYVAMTHRPDRLLDVERTKPVSPSGVRPA
jgi:hypothetical protein